MLVVDPAFWRGRRALITGHTGFKGRWLSFWLRRLGADVRGYALPVAPSPLDAIGLDASASVIGDIRDEARMQACMVDFAPEVVFHLAAQALVRPSYKAPVDTFSTNVVGTASVLQAVRATRAVRAVVVVTTDKCYENREWVWGYREQDALGGHDPYSASKAAAEIVVASMRRSFFAPYCVDGHSARIATVRAGNVIGGGDSSLDRLVPDIVRSCLDGAGDGTVRLRAPESVRPWQHVLEPSAAYLGLAQKLARGEPGVDEAFNFGPPECRTVREVAEALVCRLGRGRVVYERKPGDPHEAGLLKLDCAKAAQVLGWTPRLDLATTIEMTADWYVGVAAGRDPRALTESQIARFEALGPNDS